MEKQENCEEQSDKNESFDENLDQSSEKNKENQEIREIVNSLKEIVFNSLIYKCFRNSICFLVFVSVIFFIYIMYSEFLYINFYAFVYEWISIFYKESLVHIIFSILAVLSDFGIFTILIHVSFSSIYKFQDIIIQSWTLP